MGKEIVVIVKEGQNVISSDTVTEGSGKPLVIKAKSDQSYELKNVTTGVAPDQIYVVRDGQNLKIKIGKKTKHSEKSDKKTDDTNDADIIIEDYFDHDSSLIGVAENGQYYNFIPQGADPAASYYNLGGETLVAESETDWLPIILGTLGAGAIAAAAGGGGDNPPPPDTYAPDILTVTLTDDAEPGTGEIAHGDSTNDTTPLISGITEAGATVTARDDNGNILGTTTAGENGNYTITPTDELSIGQHYIQVTAADDSGNDITVSSVIFTVDTKAPDKPILNDTDGSPITGTAEAGSHIVITDGDGEVIGETDANQNGNFIFTPDTPVPDNTEITATATDAAGNKSGPGTITVNAALVDAPLVYDNIGPYQGYVLDGDLTDDTNPEFKGTLDPSNVGSTIKVFDNGVYLGTETVQADGSWSLTSPSDLDHGTHTITYTKDGGDPSPATQFTVDTASPTATITMDDPELAMGETSMVTIEFSEPVVGFVSADDVTVENGTLSNMTSSDEGKTWTGTFTPTANITDTTNVITLKDTYTDIAGNKGTEATTDYTIDTTPPPVIDLGDDGQLIHPVYVDGHYYYYWDKDGDGEGKTEGGSDFQDTFTHNELDAIFIYDEEGNERPSELNDTTDTYRYAELGGYDIALPTYGGDTSNDLPQHGTVIDNNPPGEDNPTYDDLVAIWDAFNGGAVTTTTASGVPEGWSEGFYWSATQYVTPDNQNNHYNMDLTNGLGATNGDHDTYWTAVEVIF